MTTLIPFSSGKQDPSPAPFPPHSLEPLIMKTVANHPIGSGVKPEITYIEFSFFKLNPRWTDRLVFYGWGRQPREKLPEWSPCFH